MRVRVGDTYHRPFTVTRTACDKVEIPIGARREPVVYVGKMCELGCWTERELLETAAANAVADEDRRTGEFERIDARQPGLTERMQREKRNSQRIAIKVLELEQERDANKPDDP